MVRVRRGNGEGTIGMPRPDVLSQEGPPRGTLMPHLNTAEELVNPRGTEREGKRSSVSRFVVYNKPILATLFGTKGKAGLKKTSWEATAIIHCGITGASQTRNSLTTNDIMLPKLSGCCGLCPKGNDSERQASRVQDGEWV